MRESIYSKGEMPFPCCDSRGSTPGCQHDAQRVICVEIRRGLAAVAVATLLTASACSSGPQTAEVRDEAQYRRADREIVIAERFAMLKRACRSENGVVEVQRAVGGRVALRPSDMETARCVRHVN